MKRQHRLIDECAQTASEFGASGHDCRRIRDALLVIAKLDADLLHNLPAPTPGDGRQGDIDAALTLLVTLRQVLRRYE